jgi:hypothetical protein
MRRYLRPTAVNCPLWARGYTRAMMTKRILTICAAVAAGTAAGTSLALAQAYPPPPGAVYSTAPQPYVQGGYPADYRRGPGVPDFDALDDDEAMNSPALPPPGPVVSPDDPRYGRRPVYTDRAMPTGPILSPDDPRYGRPDGPPPVYSDRNGAPTGPVLSPDDLFRSRSRRRSSRRWRSASARGGWRSCWWSWQCYGIAAAATARRRRRQADGTVRAAAG